jgi:AAA domain
VTPGASLEMRPECPLLHINPDHFLDTPQGRVTTPERNAWAWKECHAALERALSTAAASSRLYLMVGAQASGKSTWARRMVATDTDAIVFDAILVKRSERSPILAAARRFRVPAIAVWCQTPLSVCLERNATRPQDEVVDERGLRNVFAALEPPDVVEGFASIIELAYSAA